MKLRLATLNARVGSLLSSLPRFLSGSNPSLRNLEVIFPSEGEFTHLSGLLSSLQTWHNLRRLYISVADVDVFLRVSRLPYLHTLVLQDFKGQPSERNQESLHDPTHLFPALRLFEVETTLAIGCKLLPFLQRSKLECLSIYRDSEIAPNDTGTKALMDFVKCVGDICDPFCLKALRIRARKSRYAKFSNILHPLRGFSMLKSFELCLQKSPELSSEHVVWIGESWPNLETLSITSSEAVDYPSTVLSIFASLASQCPKLHRLKLEVDACYFTDRAAIFMRLTQADGFRNSVSSLKYLDVSTSPIEGKELVAAFLSEIFPDLLYIRSSVANKTYNSRWQKIGQLLLPMLSMTKKRERFLLDETKGSTMTASSKRDWATDDLSRLEYYWDPMVEGDGSDGDDEIDLDGGDSTDDDTIEIRH
ncbi:hypothetical protein NP233_g9968 [Leucocoprinus birnbaumii]|uniref:Uncharacterized protein n=1 Tax=Leucocoprinus birnbaumii TaxID=56174 RepID=A0AAD5YSD3_9AGAR|nr:hypothetical protein NP233_g9968 [Leucocoprinus birnbaumii]